MDKDISNNRSMLRIAIVAHALRGGGGLSAGRSLVMSLLSVEPQNTYLFLLPDLEEYRSIPLDSTQHLVFFYRRRGGLVGRIMFDTFRLPKIIREFAPDVILALGNVGIAKPPCAQAVVCRNAHRFYPFKHFGRVSIFGKAMAIFRKYQFKRTLRYTKLLLCQTDVASKRLRDTFDYKGNIALCENAISPETLMSTAYEMPKPLANLQDKMKLFCLARYYPYKNLETIVDMFERYGGDLDDTVVIITITADQHPNASKLLERIQRSGMSDRIINVGVLSQEEISSYYRHCHALLFPTFLESFTRTYLEAMHFGLPILTSDLDFAHGICGEAALYFDPWDAASIKNTILKLKNNPQLAQHLVSTGKVLLESKYQSWDNIAKILLEDLRSIVT